MNKRLVGSEYEQLAIKYLESQKVRVLEKNYRTKLGEIDIIGLDENNLVFFEVKYRKNARFGFAQEAVDIKKQIKISQVSDYYRICNKQYTGLQIRYDVIAINCDSGDINIDWIKAAFMYCGRGF